MILQICLLNLQKTFFFHNLYFFKPRKSTLVVVNLRSRLVVLVYFTFK